MPCNTLWQLAHIAKQQLAQGQQQKPQLSPPVQHAVREQLLPYPQQPLSANAQPLPAPLPQNRASPPLPHPAQLALHQQPQAHHPHLQRTGSPPQQPALRGAATPPAAPSNILFSAIANIASLSSRSRGTSPTNAGISPSFGVPPHQQRQQNPQHFAQPSSQLQLQHPGFHPHPQQPSVSSSFAPYSYAATAAGAGRALPATATTGEQRAPVRTARAARATRAAPTKQRKRSKPCASSSSSPPGSASSSASSSASTSPRPQTPTPKDAAEKKRRRASQHSNKTSPDNNKGKWTPEEDEYLRKLVGQYGDVHHWTRISQLMPQRNTKQCRERWCKHLDYNLKHGRWTPEEDAMILGLRAVGKGWAEISRCLDGRTDNTVKIRWNSLVRMQRRLAKRAAKEEQLRQKKIKSVTTTKAGERSGSAGNNSGGGSSSSSTAAATSTTSAVARRTAVARKAGRAIRQKQTPGTSTTPATGSDRAQSCVFESGVSPAGTAAAAAATPGPWQAPTSVAANGTAAAVAAAAGSAAAGNGRAVAPRLLDFTPLQNAEADDTEDQLAQQQVKVRRLSISEESPQGDEKSAGKGLGRAASNNNNNNNNNNGETPTTSPDAVTSVGSLSALGGAALSLRHLLEQQFGVEAAKVAAAALRAGLLTPGLVPSAHPAVSPVATGGAKVAQASQRKRRGSAARTPRGNVGGSQVARTSTNGAGPSAHRGRGTASTSATAASTTSTTTTTTTTTTTSRATITVGGNNKGKWLAEEDARLMQLVKEFGQEWAYIASCISGRNVKQCRERWCKHLDPELRHGAWTPSEDAIIIRARQEHKGWAEIARMLHGRTDNKVKIRWNSLVRAQDRHARITAAKIRVRWGGGPAAAPTATTTLPGSAMKGRAGARVVPATN